MSAPRPPGGRLALPPRRGGGRPVSRRRAALALAVLSLAALAGLVATGTIALPGAGSAMAMLGRQSSPRTGATQAAPRGAPTVGRGFAARDDLDLPRPPARPRAMPRAREPRPASDRVVAPTHASALFAQHSWYVPPPRRPPPPPAPPPPAPEPTAPPLPYTFVGSLAPQGRPQVFFLGRGERTIDAHVGDLIDGVYKLESAGSGQLVFVYLPLNTRQNLATGASK